MCRHFGSNSTSSVLIVFYVRRLWEPFWSFHGARVAFEETRELDGGRKTVSCGAHDTTVWLCMDRHLESS